MSASYLGFRPVNSTVRFGFETLDATGANVAPLSAFEAADLRIYKDGSDTQRSSANGITMTSPFDSLTGFHKVAIDLSDNTDAGFYAAGSFYEVLLCPDETVASVTITARVLARFDIGLPTVNTTQIEGSDATDQIGDAVWDEAVDGAVTARQSVRLANSANGGKLSGALTGSAGTVAIRDLADTKNRIVSDFDADGNRTTVTRDLT